MAKVTRGCIPREESATPVSHQRGSPPRKRSIQSAAPRLKQELDIVETQLAVLLAGGAFASIDAHPPDLRVAVVAVAARNPKPSTLEATQGQI